MEHIQTEFNLELLKVSALEIEDRSDEALNALEAFRARYGQNYWVRSAVCFHQGSILHRRGELQSALAKHKEVEVSPHDRLLFLLNSSCMARLLVELGKPDAAYDELHRSLYIVSGSVDTTDLPVVLLYISLARELRKNIPHQHRMFGCAVFHAWQIGCTDEMFDADISLEGLLTQGYAALEAQRADRK